MLPLRRLLRHAASHAYAMILNSYKCYAIIFADIIIFIAEASSHTATIRLLTIHSQERMR